jgi:hypothetical protein
MWVPSPFAFRAVGTTGLLAYFAVRETRKVKVTIVQVARVCRACERCASGDRLWFSSSRWSAFRYKFLRLGRLGNVRRFAIHRAGRSI